MGSLFSKTTPEPTFGLKPLPKPVYPRNSVADMQALSNREMELEFAKIYERSTQTLRTLSQNPCEALSQCIVECLEKNSNEMSKCFDDMDMYRSCVNEQVQDKLGDYVKESRNILDASQKCEPDNPATRVVFEE